MITIERELLWLKYESYESFLFHISKDFTFILIEELLKLIQSFFMNNINYKVICIL